MIKPLIACLIAALILAIAPWVIGEKGYVLIAFNNWTIEGSIVSFAVMTIIASIGLYILFKLVWYVWAIYGNTRFRISQRTEQKQLANLQDGLWSTLNNDHSLVLKKLANANLPVSWQGISYAFAADAALKSNQSAKALELLAKVPDEQQNYVAHLYAQTGEHQLAADLLSVAAQQNKPDVLQLHLYCQLLVAQQDDTALLEVIPKLAKFGDLTDEQWQGVWQVVFKHADNAVIEQRYEQLARNLKPLAEVAYCRALLNNGVTEKAEAILIKLLKKGHYDTVTASLKNSSRLSLLSLQKTVQELLKKQPESESLLFCLAYVALAQTDTELASKVFKKVLNEQNAHAHWRIAAHCFAAQGLEHEALQLYQTFTPT